MTNPYTEDDSDLGITNEFGEDTVVDIASTFPGIDGGTGRPQVVVVRKPRP